MKKLILLIVLIGFVYVNSAVSTPKIIYAQKKPPAVKMVKIGPKPYKSAVWISGHWEWKVKTGAFIWKKGYWTKPRKGRVWVTGHWVKKPRGWVYVQGHWKKR